jgi:hypothetical protein
VPFRYSKTDPALIRQHSAARTKSRAQRSAYPQRAPFSRYADLIRPGGESVG